MCHTPTDLLSLLKRVARSFYFSLKILPRRMRPEMGLAYLLARAADSLADLPLLAAEERLKGLRELHRAICAATGRGLVAATEIHTNPRWISTSAEMPDEKKLLAQLPDLLSELAALPPDAQQRIQSVLDALILGMERDLERFPGNSPQSLAALSTWDELDRYTYDAAGVVGPFWTSTLFAHDPKLIRDEAMRARLLVAGERFGKGLQLVNVLKDMAADYQNGRVYLPAEALKKLALAPQDLGDPQNLPHLRPLLTEIIAKAVAFLQEGERYVLALPRRAFRLRLAALWPLWIGLATLKVLARDDALLDPHRPHKISRKTLRRLLLKSLFAVFSNAAIARHDNRAVGEIKSAAYAAGSR